MRSVTWAGGQAGKGKDACGILGDPQAIKYLNPKCAHPGDGGAKDRSFSNTGSQLASIRYNEGVGSFPESLL